eukprot:5755893-Pleurochrysis_carterae.AAC.1
MQALHATLVHRGVFEEIIWARLPPDHSHDTIDRFFLVIERWLRAEGCTEIATPWMLLKYQREKLAQSNFRRDVTKVHFLLVNFAFNRWFDGFASSDKVSRIGVFLVWRYLWDAANMRNYVIVDHLNEASGIVSKVK